MDKTIASTVKTIVCTKNMIISWRKTTIFILKS